MVCNLVYLLINVLLKLFTFDGRIYKGNFKIFFKKTILKYKFVKGGGRKDGKHKKSSFMPNVPFEAVYIMATPFSPKTQPRLCGCTLPCIWERKKKFGDLINSAFLSEGTFPLTFS